MKKIFLPILITSFLFITGFSIAQNNTITIGIKGNSCDQLIIQWTSTYNFVGTGQNAWTQATFTIAYPQALGASTLGTITSLLPGFTGWVYSGTTTLVGSEYRQEVILSNGGYVQDIPIGTTEILAITLNGTGSGNFNLSNLNPQGLANTNISHGLYGTLIWNGTFSPAAANGVSLDDKIVWNGTSWCGGTGTNNQPGVGDIKPCFITGLNGHMTVWNAQVGALTVQSGGQVTIDPGASLTNTGTTTISQPQGLIIGANATGSGSYIDNGTITYTGSGSAKVQTYISNTVTAGNLAIHQIGPTVKNPSFGTSYPGASGVFLSEFQLPSSTYAYRYTEPTNTWTNFYQTTEPVPTACGMIFSGTSGSPTTLEMSGQLATDDGGATTWIDTPSAITFPTLSQWAVTYTSAGGQGNYLASNPYPSGLDLKALWTGLGGTFAIENTMRVWNHVAGNYATMTRSGATWLYTGALTGTAGLINPGQGFFLTAKAAYVGSFDYLTFYSTYRAHYFGPFIKASEEINPSTLFLHATTTANPTNNDLIIYFAADMSSGTDPNDATHWASMYEEALEVSSLSTDNTEMTVNAMPPLVDMVSIPVDFKPGVSGDFTFDFTGLDSFENGTEIFLEDIQTGAPWVNLYSNPVYNFSANDDDPLGRFILHFFGPTGISDPELAQKDIQIYGYGHDAYIVNRGTETVKEYVAYDMMGRALHSGTLPNTSVNKVTIGDASAYYIIKVITKEGGVYTGKVYITK